MQGVEWATFYITYCFCIRRISGINRTLIPHFILALFLRVCVTSMSFLQVVWFLLHDLATTKSSPYSLSTCTLVSLQDHYSLKEIARKALTFTRTPGPMVVANVIVFQ